MLRASLGRAVKFQGIGLHSGKACVVHVRPPGRVGRGILLNGEQLNYDRLVSRSKLCTRIVCSQDPSKVVMTVEHLMAALWAAGISDAEIDVEGPEIPILDGSAMPFFETLLQNRKTRAPFQAEFLRINEVWSVEENPRGCFVYMEPLEDNNKLELHVKVTLDDFGGRLPGKRTMEYCHKYGCEPSRELLEILRARTFGFEADVAEMRKMGLAIGGSLENSVVFKGDGTSAVLNEDGLRSEDEWAKHKLLDVLGDFAISISTSGFLVGKIYAHMPSHANNCAAVQSLLIHYNNS